jgi:hypothetical protein
MSKYIPKVGEAFEWRGVEVSTWFTANKCICETRKAFGYECDNGWISTVNKLCEFRPIQTKTDVELDELIEVIYNNTSLIRQYSKNVAIKIQEAGFTIPKKVKRSDVYNAVESFIFPMAGIGLTDAICEVLGDLVEQDEKGGDV